GLLVLGLAVVGVGIWQGKKLIEGIESKLKAFNHDRPGNKGYATEMASVFVAAFNPNWFGWGTDEKAVFELAQQMYDRGIGIADIDKAYSGDFVKDLESELDPDELQRFHRIRRGEEIYTTAQA
ncbi:MAG TPA: hypothetical protein DCE41_00845, partial [Cytophagales bacterium]|nr:hypothetical protein [Cytophagales bacterium]